MSENNNDPAQNLKMVSGKDIKLRRQTKWHDLIKNIDHLLTEYGEGEEWVQAQFDTREACAAANSALRAHYGRQGGRIITVHVPKRDRPPFVFFVARGENWPDGSSE